MVIPDYSWAPGQSPASTSKPTISIFFWPKSVVRTVIWGHYLIYILKEINSEYSLNGLRLKLKLQYFGHLMQRADSLERTLMLGRIEGKRRRGVTEDEMVR